MKPLSWRDLASIEVGGAICLPVIMVGHKLNVLYGLKGALMAVACGNMVLFLLALVMAKMSFINKKNTPENAQKYFGIKAAGLFACCILIAKMFWFAIQLNMMSMSVIEYFKEDFNYAFSSFWIHGLLGGFIVLNVLLGLRGVSRLSSWSMPLLVGTLLAAVYFQGKNPEESEAKEISFEAISIAIATAITAVIDMPTYFRHAKTQRDGIMAVIILFLVAIPAIEAVGIYLAYQNPAAQVIGSLKSNPGSIWNLWITAFLILAGWTTNNTNLYSASIASGLLLPKWNFKNKILLIGCCALVLSFFDLLAHFSIALQVIGIMIGSIGAIVIGNFLISTIFQKQQQVSLTHFNGWLFTLGLVTGALALTKMASLTKVPLIDAFLVCLTGCFIKFYVSSLLKVKEKSEEIL